MDKLLTNWFIYVRSIFGNLIFNIYDQDRHLLFTNKNYANAPHWDFRVKSTLECTIEAQLDANKNAGSGCAVILIGFKQK